MNKFPALPLSIFTQINLALRSACAIFAKHYARVREIFYEFEIYHTAYGARYKGARR